MSEDPIKIFENWLTQAKNAGVIEPTAVNLATISKEGFPRNRMVLFKQIIDSSFVFFTNYNSSKAKEIENQQQDDFAIEFAEWLLINAYMNGTISYKTCMLKSQGVDIKTKELLEMFKKEKGL